MDRGCVGVGVFTQGRLLVVSPLKLIYLTDYQNTSWATNGCYVCDYGLHSNQTQLNLITLVCFYKTFQLLD